MVDSVAARSALAALSPTTPLLADDTTYDSKTKAGETKEVDMEEIDMEDSDEEAKKIPASSTVLISCRLLPVS